MTTIFTILFIAGFSILLAALLVYSSRARKNTEILSTTASGSNPYRTLAAVPPVKNKLVQKTTYHSTTSHSSSYSTNSSTETTPTNIAIEIGYSSYEYSGSSDSYDSGSSYSDSSSSFDAGGSSSDW